MGLYKFLQKMVPAFSSNGKAVEHKALVQEFIPVPPQPLRIPKRKKREKDFRTGLKFEPRGDSCVINCGGDRRKYQQVTRAIDRICGAHIPVNHKRHVREREVIVPRDSVLVINQVLDGITWHGLRAIATRAAHRHFSIAA